MAYTTPQIIQWAKIAQPLARIGETKRWSNGDTSADVDLDVKLYMTRLDVEYAYAQNADSAILFSMSNYLLSLMGIYFLEAQGYSGGGGSITPINPSNAPQSYDFEVSASSFIATGAISKVFPSSWSGFNILFVRNSITQSLVNQGGVYYSWDKLTTTLTLLANDPPYGAAQETELFQIYPVL